jgi:hypothetical protein
MTADPTPATDLHFVHASGRYDAATSAVADYHARLVSDEQPHVLTATEAQQPGIVRATRQALGPQWRVRRRGEYLIAHHRDTLAPRGPVRQWLLTRIKVLPRHRQLDPAAATFRHKPTGKRVRVMVAHAPAGVQDGNHWSSDRRVRAHRSGMPRWGRRIERGARRAVQVAVMDANLDQRRVRWRQWLTHALRAPSMWERRVPETGTHGPRLIDTGHVLGAPVTDARIVATPRPLGVDHRAIAFTVRLGEGSR